MNPFDPTSTYEVPKGDSKYLKFEKGTNKFLVLASAIIGFEYWNLEGKPVRLSEKPEEQPDDIRKGNDGKPESIKHFWAFPVWDFKTSQVKILEITQKGIMNAIREYTVNPDWGSPVMQYSFTVKKDGDGLDTEYTIMANPKVVVADEIVIAWEDVQSKGFDLNRLYTGGDPFTEAKN
jgi:hypothetical protein